VTNKSVYIYYQTTQFEQLPTIAKLPGPVL